MPPGEQLAPYSAGVRHYNGKFINKRKQNIYCYYWKPTENPRALLLISHGFTEHCMMYEALATEMARRGFFVFAHDHAGHGLSDGDRGFVNDMYDLVDDSLQHIQMVREEFPHIPLFICGHSMGGTISTLSSLRSEVDVSGVVLIAPAFAANPETATLFRVMVAKFMSKFLPHFPIAATDFGLSCQNDTKVQEMNNDPLRYKGYWKVRPVVCLLQSAEGLPLDDSTSSDSSSEDKLSVITQLKNGEYAFVQFESKAKKKYYVGLVLNDSPNEEILSKTSEVKFPFLVLHGDADKICHLSGAKEFYERAASDDKTLKVYPGGYHSLLNEPSEIADDVLNQTIQWLEARV